MDYTVQEGETLSEILYNVTGNGGSDLYNQVASDNNITNADYIQAGQVIHIDKEHIQTNDVPKQGVSSEAPNMQQGVAENQTSSSKTSTSTSGGATGSSVNGEQSKTEAAKAANDRADAARESRLEARDNVGKSNESSAASARANNAREARLEARDSVGTSHNANNGNSTPTSPSYKTSSGGYRFTSTIEDDDQIVMNVETARTYINGTMDSDLSAMCGALETLVYDMTIMQGRQYGAPATKVDEDYKDFETLTKAISDFLIECNNVLDEITNYINSTELTLYN